MTSIVSIPNPELAILDGNKSYCTHANHRRFGFHNLHKIARYGLSFRSARVLSLDKQMDLRIADLESVCHLTTLPWFSGMVVIRDQHILYERYAADVDARMPHSIQSITKSLANLIVGKLVEEGVLDLALPVGSYIPEIGSGYANATVQEVLNMDVTNDYSESFEDPNATYYLHEEAMGWRLPRDPAKDETQRDFIARITSGDTKNHSGTVQYKDANTDVLGWVAERASGRPLRAFVADIVDAAGLEGTFYITADREGTMSLDGGGCMSARDLARYFSIFVRDGRGVGDEVVGSMPFIAQTFVSGVPMRTPFGHLRYSNHLMVGEHTLGHGGWGGQYALANLRTGVVGVFLSVIETAHAITADYLGPVVNMLEEISATALPRA